MVGLRGQPVGQHIEGEHLLWSGFIAPVSAGNNFQWMQIFSILGGNQRGNHAGLILLNDILRYQLFEYPVQGTGGFSHVEVFS